jgi:hypothetical protein
MHTFQQKDYVILIMCNQSNVITCLKCNAQFIYILNKIALHNPISKQAYNFLQRVREKICVLFCQ